MELHGRVGCGKPSRSNSHETTQLCARLDLAIVDCQTFNLDFVD